MSMNGEGYLQTVDADAAAAAGHKPARLKGTEADAACMVVSCVPCDHKGLWPLANHKLVLWL